MVVDTVSDTVQRAAVREAEAVVTAMERLHRLSREAAEWSAADRQSVLSRLDRAVDGLAVVRAAVLVVEKAAGTWQGRGDRSLEAQRGRTSGIGHRSAAAQVRRAEELHTVPMAAAAVTAGEISLEHAAIIARVAAAGTAAQREAARCPAGQEELLAAAREQDAGTFAHTAARWAATIEPTALDADHEAQRARRYLHVSHTPGGTFVKALLDSMAGHRLTLALEALSARPAVEDDRDHGQRQADALDAMSVRILASAETKPGAYVPPQVTMILSEETWLAARAERDRRRAHARAGRRDAAVGSPADPVTADGGDRSGGDGGEPLRYDPATLEDGRPVPASELAVAMCDCEITRIVIDAEGAPLDVGRAQRVFTGGQRRAVIARDRECAWPGCPAHARWCDVHHVRWWERDDGPTSVENGVLLCSYHHHEVHRRDLVITRRGRVEPARTASGSPPTAEACPPRAVTGPSLVNYEFRDVTGRLVGSSSRGPRAGSGPPPTRVVTTDQEELDPTWTTDPFTGARVPTFMLATP
jgi:hypothetical protein